MNVTSIEVFPRRHRQTASGSALVARYNADGTADETAFDTSALTVAQAVAIQPVAAQSDIVVAGLATASQFAMLRFLSGGSLDPSFIDTISPFAGASFTPERIAVQADGEIVVAGYVASADGTDLGIARYLANGSLDTGFGVGGGVTAGLTVATTDPCGLAIGNDGSIVAACTVQTGASDYAFGVVRLASDGTLDTSFNQSGEVTDDWEDSCNHATSVAIESDGSILVGGYDASVSGDYVDLVRFLPDGSLDANFLYGQLANEPIAGVAYSLAIQPNNMILVGGGFAEAVGGRMDFGVARLMDSGAVDQNFGAGGVSAQNLGSGSQSAVTAVAVRPDGEILAAGVVGDLPTGAPTAAAVDLYFGGEADGAIVRVDDNAPHDLPTSGDASVPANTPYTLTLGDGMADLGLAGNVTYDVNWGDGTADTLITAANLALQNDQVTHTYTFTHADTITASKTITVNLDVGNDTYSNAGSESVTVDMTSATTTALGSIASPITFGSSLTLTATVAALWPATGTPEGTVEFYDGTIDLGPGNWSPTTLTATLTTPILTEGSHTFTAVYTDDGTFDPSTSAPVSVAVNYPTFAGTLTISGTATTDEGYTLSLPQHDNTNGQQITNWIIDWGDGVVTSASGDQQAHQYGNGTQEGYMITAVATTGSDGDFQAALGPLSISDDAPGPVTLTASASNYSTTDNMILTGTFANNSPQESLNVSISWGDDSPATTFSLDPGATSFQYPAQQYARTGTYGIIATVTDADGDSSPNPSNPLTVNYSNSPPADLALSLDQSTISADDPAVNLSGSFTDLQTNIAHTVTIVWEDGAPSPDVTTLSLDAGETTFQAGPYTYPAIGSYTILVTVAGLDGSTTATTAVTPVLPDVMIGADFPAASESSGSIGEFLVTRTDTSGGNLTVYYQIAGTAQRGTDYQIAGASGTAVTGSVTIYGTASSAVIDITPYEREILGGGKTVIVSLSSGSGYNVASVFSTAMVTISDDYGAGNNLGSGPVTATMTFFNSDGSSVQGSSDQAVLGDFIAFGVKIDSGDTTGKTFYFQYDTSEIKITTDPEGMDPIAPGRGNPITLTTSYTTYYVWAADPGAGIPVDADFQLDQYADGESSGVQSPGCMGGACVPCSLNAALDALHMMMSGVTTALDVSPATVQVGQPITLSVVEQNANDVETPVHQWLTWSLPGSVAVQQGPKDAPCSYPGDYVKDYSATCDQDDQVTNFMVTPELNDYQKYDFNFYWVDDGGTQGAKVTAVVGNPLDPPAEKPSVTGEFSVTRPTVDVYATAEDVRNDRYGFNGINCFQHPKNRNLTDVQFSGGQSTGIAQAGMTFTSTAQSPNSFQYCWCQVEASWIDETSEQFYNNSTGKWDVRPVDSENRQNSLDRQFPYLLSTQTTAEDSPGIKDLTKATYSFSLNATFDMWYMCKPDGVTGIWAPLAEETWTVSFLVQRYSATTRWHVLEGATHDPPGKQQVRVPSTIQFPQWDDVDRAENNAEP